jgi:uncharacterized protein
LAGYFFDSSALAKRYHRESGSAKVETLFREPGRQNIVSRLTVVEMHSVFGIKVRMSVLSPSEGDILRGQFDADIISGAIRVFALTDFNYLRAEQLVIRYGYRRRLRSLDALQVAVALDLHDQGEIDQVVAADKELCEIALLEGVAVINPELVI